MIKKTANPLMNAKKTTRERTLTGAGLDACENTANILYSFACELEVQTVPENLNPRWALFQSVPEMEHHRARKHMMQKKGLKKGN